MLKTVKKLFDLGIVATYDKGSKTLSIEVADSSIAQADLLCRAVAFGRRAATLHCRGLGWKKVYTNGESRTVLASNLGAGVVLYLSLALVSLSTIVWQVTACSIHSQRR